MMDEARELLRELVESCTPAPAASGTIYGVRAPDRHVVEAARAFLSRPAAREQTRKWLDNNLVFYDTVPNVTGPNVPTLASVAKRIWYHATDDQTNLPFSAVIDAAIAEGKQP